MTNDERSRFERWIAASPYERQITRWPKNETWPGQYQDPVVKLAWEAWQEAKKGTK